MLKIVPEGDVADTEVDENHPYKQPEHRISEHGEKLYREWIQH